MANNFANPACDYWGLLGYQRGGVVLNLQHRQHGMSLVELAIGLVIIGSLLALAAPSYTAWIQNTKIRTTAEAILNGLQLARTEAVRRNAQIRFNLTDTLTATCVVSANGTNWIVSFDDPSGLCANGLLNEAQDAGDSAVSPAPRMIQVRPSSEGSTGVAVAADQSSIMFNGLGRVIPVPGAAININVSNPAAGTCATIGGGGGPVRCMRVAVSAGGQIRLCDPARANTDPVGC
jgi:type IV fimbrial biogenesis protein FimT